MYIKCIPNVYFPIVNSRLKTVNSYIHILSRQRSAEVCLAIVCLAIVCQTLLLSNTVMHICTYYLYYAPL